MSAPFIIPFNFQPVTAITSSSGTYTVPAGKYAKVVITNALLPVLNSTAMYVNRNVLPAAHTISTGSTSFTLGPADNVHRINLTKDGASGSIYFQVGTSSTVSAINYQFTASGSNASASYIIPNASVSALSSIAPTGGSLTVLSIDQYIGPNEIWLKSGDIFTYSSGSIFYNEYNNIS